jgi:hypothetical protein
MQEFKNFVLQKYGLELTRKSGHAIALLQDGRPLFTYFLDTNTNIFRIRSTQNGDGSNTRRFMQLVRFHVSCNDPETVVRAPDTFDGIPNTCSRKNCFKHFKHAFATDWVAFIGKGASKPIILESKEQSSDIKNESPQTSQSDATVLVTEMLRFARELSYQKEREDRLRTVADHNKSMVEHLLEFFKQTSDGMIPVADIGTMTESLPDNLGSNIPPPTAAPTDTDESPTAAAALPVAPPAAAPASDIAGSVVAEIENLPRS